MSSTTGLDVALRSITISVADLAGGQRFWTAQGLTPTSMAIHRPEHESLWDLPGGRREVRVLRSGEFLVELVRYERPEPRPRPAGYLLSDQGILNVALGTLALATFDTVLERVRTAGFQSISEPWTQPGAGTVIYLRGPEGLSVELLHVQVEGLQRMGFVANAGP